MPKVNIDLGFKYSDHVSPISEMADTKMYPSFHVESDEKIDFPHEGEMTIKFKKTSSEMREGKNGDRYSCTIEVRKIVSMYGSEKEAPSKRDKSAEEALDALAAKRMKETENDNESDY